MGCHADRPGSARECQAFPRKAFAFFVVAPTSDNPGEIGQRLGDDELVADCSTDRLCLAKVPACGLSISTPPGERTKDEVGKRDVALQIELARHEQSALKIRTGRLVIAEVKAEGT